MRAIGRPARRRLGQGLVAAMIVVATAGAAYADTLRLDPPKPAGDSADTSAQPAAEPGDDAVYARMCDAFGEGFTYSPTTGACLKIGGYVKFGTSFGTTSGSAKRSDPSWLAPR
jgi:hypothetical protein